MAVARLVRRSFFHGSHQFCGPTALSIISGKSTDEAVEVIHRLRGNNSPITKVYLGEFTRAASMLGVKLLEYEPLYRTNLNQLYNSLSTQQRQNKLVVLVTGHFTTIQNGIVVDNWYPEGQALKDCAHRRKRVHMIGYVESQNERLA